MNAYDCYREYVALKSHFKNNSYDYFRYGGKTNVKPTTFEQRNDKAFFFKLAKHKQPREFILANLVYDDFWIGDIVLNEQAQKNYKAWQKRKESLGYIFKTELGKLNPDFNANFVVPPGEHPIIIRLYLEQQICLETLVILVDIARCSSYWRKQMNDIVWQMLEKRIRKYKPFLTYEKAKFKKIVIEMFRK